MWTRLGTWELHLPPINPKPWPPRCRTMELASIQFGFRIRSKLRQIIRSPNKNVNSRGTMIVEPQFEFRLHVCSSCQWLNERSRLSTTAMPYEQKIVGMLWRVLFSFRNPLSSKISEPFFSNDWKFVSYLTMQRVILGGEICEAILWAQGGVWLLRPWRTHLCAAQPQCHCFLCTGTLFSLSWVFSNWLNVGVVSWRYVCLLDQRAQELIQLEFTNVWGRMPVRLLRSELGCSWGFPVTEPNFVSSRGSPIILQIPCS